MFGNLFKSKKDRLDETARNEEWDHKWAEAARDRAQVASLELDSNELIFADDCIDAAKDWIKAGEPSNALDQARRALSGYMLNDWLKTASDDEDGNVYVRELTEVVVAFRDKGYLAESDAFLEDVNGALVSLDEKPITLTVTGGEPDHRFPDDCPHCGAALSYAGHEREINCPYCKATIHSL